MEKRSGICNYANTTEYRCYVCDNQPLLSSLKTLSTKFLSRLFIDHHLMDVRVGNIEVNSILTPASLVQSQASKYMITAFCNYAAPDTTKNLQDSHFKDVSNKDSLILANAPTPATATLPVAFIIPLFLL